MTPNPLTRWLDRLALEMAAVWSGRSAHDLDAGRRARTAAAAAVPSTRRTGRRA